MSTPSEVRPVPSSTGASTATLDRLGTTGYTNQCFSRVQWVY
ncbi:MAG TPA: hypothetical protein VE359_02615 [Vicinamibacteria bacterium]|nr:hypothetical protein [Vicinamibacteria bacterium]